MRKIEVVIEGRGPDIGAAGRFEPCRYCADCPTIGFAKETALACLSEFWQINILDDNADHEGQLLAQWQPKSKRWKDFPRNQARAVRDAIHDDKIFS